MAYLNFLLSVPEEQVESLRKDASYLLAPTKSTYVSHLMGYWVKIEPLGKLLGKLLDGGEVANPNLWHPFRVPVFHRPAAVQELYSEISHAWSKNVKSPPKHDEYFTCMTPK